MMRSAKAHVLRGAPVIVDLDAPVRSLREAAGLSGLQFAALRGVAQPTHVQSEQTGDRIQLATLREIARLLDCDLEIRAVPRQEDDQ